MITINEYLDHVLDDFKEYLTAAPQLCCLKTLRFDTKQLPDYNDIHVQQLYLLRYAYAYAFEYKCMYMQLFGENAFENDHIQVASLGCGTGIDYWSMVAALNDLKKNQKSIKYVGIDQIDWNYKLTPREQDDMRIYKGDVMDELVKAPRLTSDIYIFPKSISEFSGNDIVNMCNTIESKPIKNNTVYLLASLRHNDGNLESDKEKMSKLFKAFNANGFDCESNPKSSTSFKDECKKKKITELDGSFQHPFKTVECLLHLNERCKKFDGDNCKADCSEQLNRWPVLNCGILHWQIFKFERR